jgi:hypothetical protein
MQPTDGKKFRDLISGMSRMYGQEPDALVLDAYWLALRDWEFEAVQTAAAHLMQTSKFMPRPAEFTELRKAGRPTVGEAWERARKACGSAIQCGQITHNGTCGDELIDRAVRAIGGYGAIAMCDRDKLAFLERRFAEHYADIESVEDVRGAMPQIASDNRPRLNGPRKLLG